jgi:hypothetical protein
MPFLNELLSDSINLQAIYDKYPDEEFLSADGFERAILGVDDDKMIIIYSTKKVLSILMEDDEMEYEDALEHFYYNIKGAYMGEKTPIFVDDIF